jgi:hypothetical protein
MSTTAARPDSNAETEGLTYQVALRALGASLDAQGASRGIRILETTAGFVVQQSSPESTGVETTQTIRFDQVWDLDGDKKLRKRVKEKDGGYRNLLDAVGRELDEAHAHMILLEEIDQDLLLTYVYPHYAGGFALLKHFTVIAPEARAELVRTVQDRRSPGKFAKGFSRLMGEA